MSPGPLPPRRARIARSPMPISYWGGLSKREIHRRLHGIGLSRRSDARLIELGLRHVAGFLSATSQERCAVTGLRTGELVGRRRARIQACHLISKGAFGADFWNLLPLEKQLHRQLHALGDTAFQALHRIDLAAAAERWAESYLARHPDVRDFLDLHLRSCP